MTFFQAGIILFYQNKFNLFIQVPLEEMRMRGNNKEKDYRSKTEIKEVVRKMHDLHPDYIFLSESGSISRGYVIKEVWKKAYSNEPLPAFYRVEPEMVLSVNNSDHNEGLKKYLKKE